MLPKGGVVLDVNRQLDDLVKDQLRVKIHVADHRESLGHVKLVTRSTEVGRIVPLYTEKVVRPASSVVEQRSGTQKHSAQNVSVCAL